MVIFQGWIAIGGDGGLLKILKFEESFIWSNNKQSTNCNNMSEDATTETTSFQSPNSVVSKSNDRKDSKNGQPSTMSTKNTLSLSLNQTLQGHSGRVTCNTWNLKHRKLASADETGLIIVWKPHKGLLYEEMINNRNHSIVQDMHWANGDDGKHICIAYSDGMVIVGCVEGTRIWGKNIGQSINSLCWSPSALQIIFVTPSQDVLVYTNKGYYLKKVMLCHHSSVTESKSPMVQMNNLPREGNSNLKKKKDSTCNRPLITCIDWYNGQYGSWHKDCPDLAIAYEDGVLELRRGLNNRNDAIIRQSSILPEFCKWNQNGHVLVLCGSKYKSSAEDPTKHREMNIIQFYNPHGKLLKSLKIPGKSKISGMCWDGSGLRIAITVDGSIYFVNVRNSYQWSAMKTTTVFASSRVSRLFTFSFVCCAA